MSDPLRIAVSVEGETDKVVLEATLRTLLPNRDTVIPTLHHEGSPAFRTGPFNGWPEVYRWARRAVEEGGGSITECSVFSNHDMLIV